MGLLFAAVHSPAPTFDTVVVRAEQPAWPAGDYSWVTWADDATLVIDQGVHAADGRNLGSRLIALRLDDAAPVALPYESSDDTCDFMEERAPTRVGDGRVAFLRQCLVSDDGGRPYSIHTMDLATGKVSLRAELGEPWTIATGFSVRPIEGEITVDLGDVMCGAIGRAVAGSIEPMAVAVPEADGANLADMWTLPCEDAVNAHRPEWSPDGRHLAVLVSRDVRGRDGWARLDADYALELIDASTGYMRTVTAGLRNAGRLAWSADGTTIAVITDSGRLGVTETWLIDVATGLRTRLVLDDGRHFDVISWSPDGTRLAGLIWGVDDLEVRLVDPVVIELPASTNLIPHGSPSRATRSNRDAW